MNFIVFHRFLSMFCNYEQFVVLPANEKKSETSSNLSDIENWLANSRWVLHAPFDVEDFFQLSVPGRVSCHTSIGVLLGLIAAVDFQRNAAAEF